METCTVLLLSLFVPLAIMAILLIDQSVFIKKLGRDETPLTSVPQIKDTDKGILFVTCRGSLEFTPEGPEPVLWEKSVAEMDMLYCISGIWREEVGKTDNNK